MLKLKKIQPTFNHILVTRDYYETDDYEGGAIVNPAGTVKRYQKVVAVGPTVKLCKEGDTVMLDFMRYGRVKHKEGSLQDGVITDNPIEKFEVPVVHIDGKDYMYMFDQDVYFIMDDYEEVDDDTSRLYVAPTPEIIN